MTDKQLKGAKMTKKAKIKKIAEIVGFDPEHITDVKIDTTTILYFYERNKFFCWKSKQLDVLQAIEVNKLFIS